MDNGVTDEGFKRKRLPEILADKNAAVTSVLGSNLNLTPESPDGQINGVYSESDANLWEIAEACYNAFAPTKATGAALSNLVQLNAIEREPAIATTAEVTVSGTPSTVIPLGSLVSTLSGNATFSTDIEVTIPIGGSINIAATNIVTGPIEALAGSITVIDSPITGWDNVTNAEDALPGQNEETDAELRIRRLKSVTKPAVTVLESITSEILALPLVTYAVTFENQEDAVDANGLPPHSIRSIVEGGEGTDIASAILLKKPTGISTSGNTTDIGTDSQGVEYTVFFSRPTPIDIYIQVNIDTFEGFPETGIDDIKQAIVDYANGNLVVGKEFGVSDDVIRTELYTPINFTAGISISLLTIAAGGAPSVDDTDDISIAFNEKSQFTLDNIEVTII